MRILITTWGDPKKWNAINYHIFDKVFKSNTTYIPLFEIEKPDKGIIIVQNSLLASFFNFETLKKEKDLDYILELKIKIKEKLKEFLNNADDIEGQIKKEILEKTDVIVVISSGYFKINDHYIRFFSDFYDILLNLFIEIYFHIRDSEPNEIILDLTHGLNYFALSTLIALLYLKKIFNFKLKIYNSTPVASEIKDAHILNLGEVILEGKIILSRIRISQIHKKLRKIFKDKMNFEIEKVFDLIVSYLYGLIFPLVDRSNFKFNLEIIRELVPQQRISDNEYKVNYMLNDKIDINSRELFEYVFTLLLAHEISKKFNKFNRGKRKINLNDLEEIIKLLPNEVAKVIANKEYMELKRVYDFSEKVFEGKECILYKQARTKLESMDNIENVKKSKKRTHDGEGETRNFFAHASFLYNRTKLYKDGTLEFVGDYKGFLERIEIIQV